MKLEKLKDCFPAEDIEWRVQRSGKTGKGYWAVVLAYVTNRAIQQRLDDVCGPENWKNEFASAPNGGVICGISIKCGNEWVTKWDGADNTAVEAVKGGLSNSMKRAAVQWGIGRYLYKLDSTFAQITENGKYKDKCKDDGGYFSWDPPQLPEWALPSDEETEQLIDSAREWMDTLQLSDKEIQKAQYYISNKDKTGLQKFINFCKQKEVTA